MAIIVAERLREWIKSRSESTQRELLVSMRWKLIWIGVGVHKTVFISFIPHHCCNERHRSCVSGQTQLWMIEYLGCSSLFIQVYKSLTPWPVLHLLSLSLRRYTPDHPVRSLTIWWILHTTLESSCNHHKIQSDCCASFRIQLRMTLNSEFDLSYETHSQKKKGTKACDWSCTFAKVCTFIYP